MQQTFPDFGNTMLITMAKRMLARNFSRIQFKFEEVTWNEPKSSRFGVYLHVPFCKKLCAFCPFYKVLYDEQLKDAYLNALTKEIKMRIPQGEIPWFYMGGGTPNLLDPPEIEEIISTVRDNRSIDNMGMEGTPRQFTRTYLRKIKAIGMDKISMGIESLNPEALHHVHRDVTNKKHITNLIEYAKDLGLSVNVDLMIGLPSQTNEDFLRDIKELAKIGPQQITTYPFLVIPGVQMYPEMSSNEMFHTIELAGRLLKHHGYTRESIWIFSHDENVYDSAGEELVSDYLGVGPAAFSKIKNLQTVNPPLEIYLDMLDNESPYGFRARVNEHAENWRKFAHELYNLKLDRRVIEELPTSVQSVLFLLKLTGNIHENTVTRKGRLFVHEITKTVVENLPFPLSNPSSIENREKYMEVLRMHR